MTRSIDPLIDAMIGKEPAKQPAPPVEDEKEPNTTVLVWSLVIIGVIVAAILLFRSVYTPPEEVVKVDYNNYEFIRLPDEFWEFRWQKDDAVYHVPLRYNPTQLGNVTVTGYINNGFGRRRSVHIAVDPTNRTDLQYLSLGTAELSLNLLKAFGVNIVASCTRNETSSCMERPVVDCDDKNISVIIVREAPGPTVDMRGDCIVVQGENMGLLQAVDRLLFTFYGIMD